MSTSRSVFVAIVLFICTFQVALATQRRLADAGDGFSPRMTTETNTVTKAEASVTITFSSCVNGFTVDDLTVTAEDGKEVATFDPQLTASVEGMQFTYSFGLEDKSVASTMTVTLKGGSVNLFGSDQTNKETSVSFQYERLNFGAQIATEGAETESNRGVFNINFDRDCRLSLVEPQNAKAPFADKLVVSAESGTGYIAGVEFLADNQWHVEVRSLQNTDTLNLQALSGACSNFGNGNTASNKASVTLTGSAVGCGQWSAWSDCTQTCTYYNAYFQKQAGSQTRSRTSLPGQNCQSPSQTRVCNDAACAGQSRPFSGESLQECLGCRSKNWNTYAQENNKFVTPSGCRCQRGCAKQGDCCQAWFGRKCSWKGSLTSPFYARDSNRNPWKPSVCSAQQCDSDEPVLNADFPSYFCYCNANCGADGTKKDECCSGSANRETQCTR